MLQSEPQLWAELAATLHRSVVLPAAGPSVGEQLMEESPFAGLSPLFDRLPPTAAPQLPAAPLLRPLQQLPPATEHGPPAPTPLPAPQFEGWGWVPMPTPGEQAQQALHLQPSTPRVPQRPQQGGCSSPLTAAPMQLCAPAPCDLGGTHGTGGSVGGQPATNLQLRRLQDSALPRLLSSARFQDPPAPPAHTLPFPSGAREHGIAALALTPDAQVGRLTLVGGVAQP